MVRYAFWSAPTLPCSQHVGFADNEAMQYSIFERFSHPMTTKSFAGHPGNRMEGGRSNKELNVTASKMQRGGRIYLPRILADGHSFFQLHCPQSGR